MKRRFHLLAPAHQPTASLVPSCSHTIKVLNMSIMLRRAGHEVFLYHPGSQVDYWAADEAFQCVADQTMHKTYGPDFAEKLNSTWDQNDPAWIEYRKTAGRLVSQNLTSAGDIVLASFGDAHQNCCPASSQAMTVEMSVGYAGIFASRKVWESNAWRSYMCGRLGVYGQKTDAVIPGFFNEDDFHVEPRLPGAGDHLLYLGRVTEERGVLEAYHLSKISGVKLVIAGSGDSEWIKGSMPEAEYAGVVGEKERGRLLRSSIALVSFIHYVEPFSQAVVEAMHHGVPSITSDWGCFPEVVEQGRTGFRCSNIHQMKRSLDVIREGKIYPSACTEGAENFELKATWPRYEQYIEHQHAIFRRENGIEGG